MSLQSTAQDLIEVYQSDSDSNNHEGISLIPLEVMEEESLHDHDSPLEISEPVDIEIVVEELPGAPTGTHDPEPLEVVEENKEEAEKPDENDAKKSKKNEKWDWESKGPHGFVAWIKSRIDDVPKHSGYDSAGLERAVSYLERLDNEISRAMRLDLDGELDANKIEAVRSQIDEGLSRLHDRLDKVKKHSKTRRKKKAELSESMIKEAQKITGVQGTFVTVPLLISGIARVCINGMVSAGHDIEEIYKDQVKKYSLNEREKSEVRWLLLDMGYGMRGDRGFLPEEDFDPASSDNYDYAANYKG